MNRWLICGSFAAMWTVLLLLPGSEYDRVGMDQWSEIFKTCVTKTAHVLAYGFFAFLCGWVRVLVRFRWMLLFLVMAHGAATELLQQGIQGRTGCLEDVCINYGGVLLGLVAGWKWWTDPE